MASAETFASKAAACDAALSEIRVIALKKARACLEMVGGRGYFRVTEYLRSRKIVKRYRWTSGEAA
jgi:hypothetical protein